MPWPGHRHPATPARTRRESRASLASASCGPNLRAAVAWACAAGDPELADALVRPIATELTLRARQEIGDWAEDILAMAPAADADLRAFWLLWVAERYVQNGDAARVRAGGAAATASRTMRSAATPVRMRPATVRAWRTACRGRSQPCARPEKTSWPRSSP